MRETIRNMGVWRKCLKMANNAVSWSGQKWEECTGCSIGFSQVYIGYSADVLQCYNYIQVNSRGFYREP